MAKDTKNNTGVDNTGDRNNGARDLNVKETPSKPKRGRPTEIKRDITKTSQSGLREGLTRATFIIREDTLDKLKERAYTDRKKLKDLVTEALDYYLDSGNWNSGNWNSGYWNSGNRNSGNWNSGYGNSGYGNSGYGNSGNRNSGDWNSGYGNRTDRETGIFNTTQGKIRCFNKETDIAWDDIQHPYFSEFYLNKWIPESDMTDSEKIAYPDFFVRGGYLKTYEWEEAWSNYWRDCHEEEKQRVLNLPNFDPAIFKEVTGIDVQVESKPETIVIGDKRYQVTDELKDALKNLKEA